MWSRRKLFLIVVSFRAVFSENITVIKTFENSFLKCGEILFWKDPPSYLERILKMDKNLKP